MTEAEKADIRKAVAYVRGLMGMPNWVSNIPEVGRKNVMIAIVCEAAEILIDTQPTMVEFQKEVKLK